MSNPLWMRSAMVAVAIGLFGAASCGDNGNDDEDKRDPCDLEANPDLDCDGDGLPNGWEVENGFDPLKPDVTEEGVLMGWADPDEDGLPTWAEIALGLDYENPRTPNADGTENLVLDGLRDYDGDGSVNMAEAWMGKASAVNGTITPVWDPASTDGEKPYVCNPLDDAQGSELFTDMAFRFTSLKVTLPQVVGPLLSGIMQPDIQKYVLNIMAPVSNFQFGHCVSYFDLYAGSGVGPELIPLIPRIPRDKEENEAEREAREERNDEIKLENEDIDAQNVIIANNHTFTLEDLQTFDPDATITESTRAVVIQTSDTTAFFRTVLPLSMVFPGTSPVDGADGKPKRFLLDLTHITAAGTLTLQEDGTVSLDAFIDGVIPFESAETTMVQLSADKEEQSIAGLMGSTAPEFSVPGSDEAIGYNLRASFSAETVKYDPEDDEDDQP